MSAAGELELLQEQRAPLFHLELAGLLHDIGKLQTAFLEYRANYQRSVRKDPHECAFLSRGADLDKVLDQRDRFKSLIDYFQEKIGSLAPDGEWRLRAANGDEIVLDKSMAELVGMHTKPDTSELAQWLKAADSKDAAEDRNNPLVVNEQSAKAQIFKSTVFGYETPVEADLEVVRKTLYQALQDTLINTASAGLPVVESPSADLRARLHKTIREAFRQSVSDTCRPANDIDLWEHSYATATLYKVLLADFVLYGREISSCHTPGQELWLSTYLHKHFSLWGVGWNALRFFSSAHKIGDITGRKRKIQELKLGIREIVEWDLSLGNAIYDHDDGVYFIIPEIREGQENAWFDELKQRIRQVNRTVTEDELAISFSSAKRTTLMVPIVGVIDEVKKTAAIPWRIGAEEAQNLRWVSDWENAEGRVVCPICRKRPLTGDDRACCLSCERIRTSRKPTDSGTLAALETNYHNEIALGNCRPKERLALLVGCFSLDKWLDGTMLYSQFVKQAHGLDNAMKHLGLIHDLAARDKYRIDIFQKEGIDYSATDLHYADIIKLVNLCCEPGENAELAKAYLFLFHLHWADWKYVEAPPKDWTRLDKVVEDLKAMGIPATLANYLMTKNHSPSRLLRIWNGTRDFFLEQAEKMRRACRSEGGRMILSIRAGDDIPENAILTGSAVFADPDVPRLPLEVAKRGNEIWVLNRTFEQIEELNWGGAVLRLDAEEFRKGRQAYEVTVSGASKMDLVRARTITVSPDLFMAVVPADRAIPTCKAIHEDYIKRMGKSYGRLPMSLGAIFFKTQTPMFVVLDSARRMIRNFERLWRAPLDAQITQVSNASRDFQVDLRITKECWERDMTLCLPVELEEGVVDRFHPYFAVKEGTDLHQRKSYFKTAIGEVIHYGDLAAGDTVSFYPNYFDFEFLDSTQRRYSIDITESDKRPSGSDRRNSRPLFLEDIAQNIERMWKILEDYTSMTDSKVRNFRSLMDAWSQWAREDDGGRSSFRFFVESALRKELPMIEGEHLFIIEQAGNGLLFDTFELYLEILKERVG